MHLVDDSGPDPALHMDAVRQVLGEIGAGAVPELVVFNKIDLTHEAERLVARHPGSVAVSAATGEGIDGLLAAVADRLRALTNVVELVVPFDRGDVLAAIHREGEVLVETPGEEGMRLRARLDDAASARLADYVVG